VDTKTSAHKRKDFLFRKGGPSEEVQGGIEKTGGEASFQRNKKKPPPPDNTLRGKAPAPIFIGLRKKKEGELRGRSMGKETSSKTDPQGRELKSDGRGLWEKGSLTR